MRRLDDRIDVFDCLRAFDLGDNLPRSPGLPKKPPRFVNILSRAHEGDRQEIDLEFGSKPDVLPIDIRQCRRRQTAALQVDALVIGQNAAVNDRRVNTRALDAVDVQRYQAIVQKQRISRAHIFMQGIEGNPDSILITIIQSERAIQEEGIAVSPAAYLTLPA